MTKLYTEERAARRDPILGLDGAFAAPLPDEVIEEIGVNRNFADNNEALVWFGEKLLRDKDDEPFEDLASVDAIRASGMSLQFKMHIARCCFRYFTELTALIEKKAGSVEQ